MDEKATAFGKGGCGCLIAFAVLAVLALLMGGRVHIDPCGAACLFVAGGIIGLIVLAIYKKGQKDGQQGGSS
jgi:hypothetical protein